MAPTSPAGGQYGIDNLRTRPLIQGGSGLAHPLAVPAVIFIVYFCIGGVYSEIPYIVLSGIDGRPKPRYQPSQSGHKILPPDKLSSRKIYLPSGVRRTSAVGSVRLTSRGMGDATA